MHIAFDMHGVLTEYPNIFQPIMALLKDNGIDISIMSGPPRPDVVRKLEKYGYKRGIHFDHVISIVDYLHYKNAVMKLDEKGTWWTDDETWWKSKGELCKEFKVGILIDNSPEYAPFIDSQETIFLLLNGGKNGK